MGSKINQPTIAGVTLSPLREIIDNLGSVLHITRGINADITDIGECYCSEVLPGAVKAWKLHTEQTQNIAIPVGLVRFVLYDRRANSDTKNTVNIFELGRPTAYQRLTIPPSIWYGFTALSSTPALVVNCTKSIHDPNESERLDKHSSEIPYRW